MKSQIRLLLVVTLAGMVMVGGLVVAAPAQACCNVTVNPTQAAPGTAISVTGQNWTPGGTLQLEWLFGAEAGSALVDGTGAFEATITVPQNAPTGPTTLYVGNPSLTSERGQASFTVAPPPPDSPNAPPDSPNPPPDSKQPSQNCAQIALVGLRGSGESGGGADLGPTLEKVHQILNNELGSVNVKVYGTRYEARAVDWKVLLLHPAQFYASVSQGSDYATASVHAITRGNCGKRTEIIVLGYSQGAWAARLMLAQLGSKARRSIAAVGLLGDPLFDPHSPAATGDSQHDPRYGVANDEPVPRYGRPRLPDSLTKLTMDWCRFHDPVCNGRRFGNGKREAWLTWATQPWVRDCFAGPSSSCKHFAYEGKPMREVADFLVSRIRHH